MHLHLDAETEQRIQREIDLGHHREPSEVITHALNLLQAEQEWLSRNREQLDEHLGESMAQIERGEGIPGDQVLAVLAARRQSRTTR